MNIGGLWFIGGGPGILENTARKLSVKKRRKIGIILLSGGIILSIIGLVLLNIIHDSDAPILIPLILLGLGITTMVMSVSFFRKFENRGWLEDALFHWSFWSDSLEFLDHEVSKRSIICPSCNQKLNIPFGYSGKISCPVCGIDTELEGGKIELYENPSDQG